VLSTAVDATTFSLEAKEEGDFESSALPTSDYVHQLAMQKPASSPIRREAVLKALLDTGEAILPNLQKSIDRVLDNYAMTRIVADLASVSSARWSCREATLPLRWRLSCSSCRLCRSPSAPVRPYNCRPWLPIRAVRSLPACCKACCRRTPRRASSARSAFRPL